MKLTIGNSRPMRSSSHSIGSASFALAGIIGCVISTILISWAIVAEIFADYEYEKTIGSFWSLADKASTLEAKSQYLDKFVAAIEVEQLSGYNAIVLKTPDNSVEQNLAMLRTLQTRMKEIKGMDVTSFAYQQAIQQITAQEQGEADHLLSVIEGTWYLKHHAFLWDWIDVGKWLLLVVFAILSAISLIAGWDED